MARSAVFWIRKSHRYLGLFIGIQLLLWTVSGLYFTWNHISVVRGEHLRAASPAVDLGQYAYASPSVAIQKLAAAQPDLEQVMEIKLRMLLGSPVFEIAYQAGGKKHHALADARSGALRPPLDRDEAIALARADFTGGAEVASVTLVTQVPDDSEYRGGALPAYRVTFAHPTNTNVYVSTERGLVTARRNNTWRTFDFLWMFHIMDYEARDNINNTLLQILSILGVITVISGFVLFVATSRLMRRRRSTRAAAT